MMKRKLAIGAMFMVLGVVASCGSGVHFQRFLISIGAKAPEPITIHVAELPFFASKERIRWLNPPMFGSSHDGDSPLIRYNDAQTYPTQLTDYITLNERSELFGGWTVQPPDKPGCLNYTLLLRRGSQIAKFDTKLFRNDDFFNRRFYCLGMSAAVYHAFYLNSQYIAFETAEPGWIFFDYKNGKFKPFIVAINRNNNSNLFVTNSGRVLVDIQTDPRGKTGSTSADRDADGLREVIVNGESIQAPLNEADIVEVAKIKKKNECAGEESRSRRGYAGSKPCASDPLTPLVSGTGA